MMAGSMEVELGGWIFMSVPEVRQTPIRKRMRRRGRGTCVDRGARSVGTKIFDIVIGTLISRVESCEIVTMLAIGSVVKGSEIVCVGM